MSDLDQELNIRSIKATMRMDRHIRETGVVPEFAMCLSAQWAHETWKLIQGSFQKSIEGTVMGEPHLSSSNKIFRSIQTISNNVRRLSILIENSGIHKLFHHFVGCLRSGDAKSFSQEVCTRVLTARLSLLTREACSWSEFNLGSAQLEEFIHLYELS